MTIDLSRFAFSGVLAGSCASAVCGRDQHGRPRVVVLLTAPTGEPVCSWAYLDDPGELEALVVGCVAEAVSMAAEAWKRKALEGFLVDGEAALA